MLVMDIVVWRADRCLVETLRVDVKYTRFFVIQPDDYVLDHVAPPGAIVREALDLVR
jgi:hypothetical protein